MGPFALLALIVPLPARCGSPAATSANGVRLTEFNFGRWSRLPNGTGLLGQN